MNFVLTSPAIEEEGVLPLRYTARGSNVSPPLYWADPPPGTQSYVLIMEDISAPIERPLRHWVIYDIPAGRRRLGEGLVAGGRTENLPHAMNDFGHFYYEGPNVAPEDVPHHYRFRLAALGVRSLGVPPQSRASVVWDTMRDYLLAEAELVCVSHPSSPE